MKIQRETLSIIFLMFLILTGCTSGGEGDSKVTTVINEKTFLEKEEDLRKEYQEKPIDIKGSLIDDKGVVAGAEVTVQNETVTSDENGFFEIKHLTRINSLMTVSADSYRSEIININLLQDLSMSQYLLEPVILRKNNPNTTRFLFSGDTAFARRFLDPTDATLRDQLPTDHTDALIMASDPLPGTKAALQFIRPFYQEADFGVLNLESTIIHYPETPHLEKDFAYFTFPESLPALTWLGVDYVSLGNNHVYDYLEKGLEETLIHLREEGIFLSGAGMNSDEAFEPYHIIVNGSKYSFISATSISGEKHSISYVATDTKGGAADLRMSSVLSHLIQDDIENGNVPIVQLHGGTEYSYEPQEYIKGRIDLASKEGASLIVTHHPHVAQGVGIFNNKVALMGMGNFAFDQDRHETFLSIMGRVDMNGSFVESVRLLPIYLEDYRPRPICGDLASMLMRRIGEYSVNYGGLLFFHQNQGWMNLGLYSVNLLERQEEITVTIPESGKCIVDLRKYKKMNESLAGYELISSSATIRTGKDLLLYGDFEDWDVDPDIFETVRWDMSSDSVLVSLSEPYRGLASAVIIRYSSNTADSVLPFRNRVRVMGDELNSPEKDLSFLGYLKMDGSGPVRVVSRYYSSYDDIEYGEEDVYTSDGGFSEWHMISGEMHMPEDLPELNDPQLQNMNPRSFRLFIHQSPPVVGKGFAFFDDITVISWDSEDLRNQQHNMVIPNTRDFFQISGTPGEVVLKVIFAREVPFLL